MAKTAIGQIFIAVNGQILKNNIAICSHCGQLFVRQLVTMSSVLFCSNLKMYFSSFDGMTNLDDEKKCQITRDSKFESMSNCKIYFSMTTHSQKQKSNICRKKQFECGTHASKSKKRRDCFLCTHIVQQFKQMKYQFMCVNQLRIYIPSPCLAEILQNVLFSFIFSLFSLVLQQIND